MIAIHFRTPKSLELSISAGRHVRHFAASRVRDEWALDEFRGNELILFGRFSLLGLFDFLRLIEKNLLTFQKSEFK